MTTIAHICKLSSATLMRKILFQEKRIIDKKESCGTKSGSVRKHPFKKLLLSSSFFASTQFSGILISFSSF